MGLDQKVKRPVLRYPGGKWRLADWIISHFPPYKFYCEPFCGGASVFMRKNKSGAEVINDINVDLINVFQVLRDPVLGKELERLCRLTPLSYREYENAYINDSTDSVERARKTIYRSYASIGTDGVSRNRAGFRGLKNYESGITTAHEWMRYPENIQAFIHRLEGVIIECRPALKCIAIYDSPETLFYLDPPYTMNSRSQKRRLYGDEMGNNRTEEEALHRELAAVAHAVQGKVIISGYQSDLYTEIFGDWQMILKAARAQGNGKRVEAIWLSPNIQPTLFR